MSWLLGLALACTPASDSGMPADSAAGLGGGVALLHGPDLDAAEALDRLGLSDVTLVDGTDAELASDWLVEGLASVDLLVVDEGLAEEGLLHGEGSADGLGALEAWVEGGGVLLTTSRSYEAAEAVVPDAFDFVGEDEAPGDAEVAPAQDLSLVVSDGGLAAQVQADAIDGVALDAGAAPIAGTADDVGVHLRADVDVPDGSLPQSPVLVTVRHGDGAVAHSVPRLSSEAPDGFLLAVWTVVSDL